MESTPVAQPMQNRQQQESISESVPSMAGDFGGSPFRAFSPDQTKERTNINADQIGSSPAWSARDGELTESTRSVRSTGMMDFNPFASPDLRVDDAARAGRSATRPLKTVASEKRGIKRNAEEVHRTFVDLVVQFEKLATEKDRERLEAQLQSCCKDLCVVDVPRELESRLVSSLERAFLIVKGKQLMQLIGVLITRFGRSQRPLSRNLMTSCEGIVLSPTEPISRRISSLRLLTFGHSNPEVFAGQLMTFVKEVVEELSAPRTKKKRSTGRMVPLLEEIVRSLRSLPWNENMELTDLCWIAGTQSVSPIAAAHAMDLCCRSGAVQIVKAFASRLNFPSEGSSLWSCEPLIISCVSVCRRVICDSKNQFEVTDDLKTSFLKEMIRLGLVSPFPRVFFRMVEGMAECTYCDTDSIAKISVSSSVGNEEVFDGIVRRLRDYCVLENGAFLIHASLRVILLLARSFQSRRLEGDMGQSLGRILLILRPIVWEMFDVSHFSLRSLAFRSLIWFPEADPDPEREMLNPDCQLEAQHTIEKFFAAECQIQVESGSNGTELDSFLAEMLERVELSPLLFPWLMRVCQSYVLLCPASARNSSCVRQIWDWGAQKGSRGDRRLVSTLLFDLLRVPCTSQSRSARLALAEQILEQFGRMGHLCEEDVDRMLFFLKSAIWKGRDSARIISFRALGRIAMRVDLLRDDILDFVVNVPPSMGQNTDRELLVSVLRSFHSAKVFFDDLCEEGGFPPDEFAWLWSHHHDLRRLAMIYDPDIPESFLPLGEKSRDYIEDLERLHRGEH